VDTRQRALELMAKLSLECSNHQNTRPSRILGDLALVGVLADGNLKEPVDSLPFQ